MSWIKTLWLWEEVALCLLLGLSLVWGHMWWVAGVLVVRLRQPQIRRLDLNFFFIFTPPPRWLPYVLFKNDCTDPAPHSLISCTCTKGPAGLGGHGPYKKRRTRRHTFPPGSLTLLYLLRPRVRAPLSTGALQLRSCEDAARLERTPFSGHGPWQLRSVLHLFWKNYPILPFFL